MITLATRSGTVTEASRTVRVSIFQEHGGPRILVIDRETLTLVDGAADEKRRDPDQLQIDTAKMANREIVVGDIRLTVGQLLDGLDQLTDELTAEK